MIGLILVCSQVHYNLAELQEQLARMQLTPGDPRAPEVAQAVLGICRYMEQLAPELGLNIYPHSGAFEM